MAYKRVNWENLPSTKTPVNEDNLNKMDEGINAKQDKLTAGTGIEITETNIINNLNANYSTEETKIGTWIDGKPLYRKVVNAQFGTVVQGTETTLEVNLKNVDFILVDKYWLDRKPEAINQGYSPDTLHLGYTSFSNSNTTLRFRTKQSWASNTAIYAIVEYTKTTD